jgi:riboflavin biosynthesis pyrimidine reductase
MTDDTAPVTSLEALYDTTVGIDLPLPPALADFYGAFRLPAPADRPHLYANFVTSLDGVVSLGEPGTGGKDISGDSREDRAVMGLLRAAADIVVVGSGTLRSVPRHVWTAEAIYAPFGDAYRRLREALGRREPPLTVVVTSTGDVDPTLPVFTAGRAPAVVVTTPAGARALAARGGRLDVRVTEVTSAEGILDAVAPAAGARVLLECGPRLMAAFLDARRVDELFLTLAPEIAGRAPGTARESFVAGAVFLPDRPFWGDLRGVKRSGSFLFLRYGLPAKSDAALLR